MLIISIIGLLFVYLIVGFIFITFLENLDKTHSSDLFLGGAVLTWPLWMLCSIIMVAEKTTTKIIKPISAAISYLGKLVKRVVYHGESNE